MKSNNFFFSVFLTLAGNVWGQSLPPVLPSSPNGEKYLYPIKPGQPGSLAGNMGELRATHFHSGIDIRTNNLPGFAVLASKSGYISRAGMSSSGYGNVLYITHPDGNTTLYAHLLSFSEPLAKYILEEQYRRKSFEIDLFFREGQFPVNQGDTIALSGNTGSSGGPHLHFDIRNPDNHAIDPLSVKFPEIRDVLPPMAKKIALRTMDIHSRVNDRFGRVEFYAKRVGNQYILSQPILAHGNIGIELLATDLFEPKSVFYGGVKHIDVLVDGQKVFSQSIEKINISETRKIYTMMDFRTLRTSGSRFYKLYVEDGNSLEFYQGAPTRGQIHVDGSKDQSVTIEMRDVHGNLSKLLFRVRHSPLAPMALGLEAMKENFTYAINENTLILNVRPCTGGNNAITLYSPKGSTNLAPTYYNKLRWVYLLDLRQTLPDSVVGCGFSFAPNIKAVVPPGKAYTYYNERLEVSFPEETLFDTAYLNISHRLQSDSSELFTLGDEFVPLNNPIDVSVKPLRDYPWDATYAVYRKTNRGLDFEGGEWNNGHIHFMTRDFGNFIILRDTLPPTVKPVYIDRSSVRFRIKDDRAGIASYEATLNGKWLLMHFDSKSGTLWSQRLENSSYITGHFELTVTDNAGNRQVFQQLIN